MLTLSLSFLLSLAPTPVLIACPCLDLIGRTECRPHPFLTSPSLPIPLSLSTHFPSALFLDCSPFCCQTFLHSFSLKKICPLLPSSRNYETARLSESQCDLLFSVERHSITCRSTSLTPFPVFYGISYITERLSEHSGL